jgi:predicted aspartyl protease
MKLNQIRKLFLLTIFLASVFFNSYAQTKEETEEWIKNKIETNAYSDTTQSNEYSVSFENCKLIIRAIEVRHDDSPFRRQFSISEIPLKDMWIYIQDREPDNPYYDGPKIMFDIIAKDDNGNGAIRTKINDNEKYEKYNNCLIFLRKPLRDKEKMVKYFSHLIVLCGGDALVEDKKSFNNPQERCWFQKLPTQSPSSNKIAYVPKKESNKSPSSNTDDVIQMQKMGSGLYEIPVMINDVLKISFIFDSGASDVSISPDVAATLMRTGTVKESDFIGSQKYSFGDGSTAINKRFIIRKLSIGNHVVTNVTATISNSINAPMLLGQSVQQKFGKITIDNTNHTIAFGK